MITQRELKRILKYDKETGIFYWKKSTGSRAIKGNAAGSQMKTGYIEMSVCGKRYTAHRLAFLYVLGYLPENDVDHINRIRIDNRWCNLREVSTSCNLRNCKINKNNKSGITGVYFHKINKKWVVQVPTENNKQKHIGTFCDLKEAARARYNAEVALGYPDCDINSTAKQYLDSL